MRCTLALLALLAVLPGPAGALLGYDDGPVDFAVPSIPDFPVALDDHCVVAILNRVGKVQADGTWQVDNVPSNFGPVRARATCLVDGRTYSGQSEPFTVPQNGSVSAGWITFVDPVPVPTGLAVSILPTQLATAGATAQVTTTATLSDGGAQDVTADVATTYRTSNAAIATVNAQGTVTAVSSGTALVTVLYEGISGFAQVHIALSSTDGDGDGIPDDVELANGLDPNDPVDAEEDLDGDGLTNKDELLTYGTQLRNPDSDGDGIQDGEEVTAGADGFATNPLAADTDGDGVRDGLEVQTGSDPTDPNSYNLAQALSSLTVDPASFALTVNTIISEAYRQLAVTGHLKDGTTLDLTSTARGTGYLSSDLGVCTIGPPDGRVFGGGNGPCTITVSNAGFTAQATAAVTTFAPTALSFLAIPGFANAVDVSGDVAYVAAGAAGLQLVDVSDRSAPAIVGALPLPGNANDVRVAGTTAYVAAGAAGLRVVDVADPSDPAILGAAAGAGPATDLVVRGHRVVVAEAGAGVQVFDVTNPAAPELLGTKVTLGIAQGVDVSADGTRAVVAERAGGIEVLDLTDPASITSLGHVSTGGDARDVVLDGDVAFVADYVKSFTVVDVSNPASPVLGASTPQATGGLLTEIARAGQFAFGADVFFVNGTPIIDVSDPTTPLPRAILDFSSFRDDNGTGIAVDGVYAYVTAEQSTIGTEDGVLGDTRLYIGQYVGLVDTAGSPPAVAITSPSNGAGVIAGETVSVAVTATDDVAVVRVDVLANGTVVASDTSPPYELPVVVPAGASLVLGARAIDPADNVGMAADVVLTVMPDPGTTADGVVVDGAGMPVEGASVTCDGVQGTSGADGHFSIGGVPTVHGKLRCAAIRSMPPPTLSGRSGAVSPVRGGTTDLGTITIAAGKIYYSRVAAMGQSNDTIWRANTDGSGEEMVTVGAWPRLSPDGTRLVFLRDGSGITFNNTIVVRNLETGVETPLYGGGDYKVNFDWTPDGTQIAFDYVCAILIMNADGSNAHTYVAGNCYDDCPAINAVDGTVAFHNAYAGLLLANADGSNRRQIPNTMPGDYWPAWSPDGQWISFGHISNDNQNLQNYFKIHPDGTERTQLTFFDPTGPDRTGIARAWSPDGATLVVPGTIAGVPGLYALATDGSGSVAPIPVPAGELPDFVGGVTGAVVVAPPP